MTEADAKKLFDRYEHLLEAFVNAYKEGKPYVFTPSVMAPTTYVIRIRDAIRAARAFGLSSRSLSNADLVKAWDGSIIKTLPDGKVYMGPRVPTKPPIEDTHRQLSKELKIRVGTDEAVKAVLVLAEQSCFEAAQVQFANEAAFHSFVDQAPSYEVAWESQGEGTIILI